MDWLHTNSINLVKTWNVKNCHLSVIAFCLCLKCHTYGYTCTQAHASVHKSIVLPYIIPANLSSLSDVKNDFSNAVFRQSVHHHTQIAYIHMHMMLKYLIIYAAIDMHTNNICFVFVCLRVDIHIYVRTVLPRYGQHSIKATLTSTQYFEWVSCIYRESLVIAKGHYAA